MDWKPPVATLFLATVRDASVLACVWTLPLLILVYHISSSLISSQAVLSPILSRTAADRPVIPGHLQREVMKLSKHPASQSKAPTCSSVGKKEQKKSAEKRRFSITRGQGNFDIILEDEPLTLPDSDNLSDYYEVAPERLEVVGLPPEESGQKKDR